MNLKSTGNFKIESLGIQERYVYDIEVEDNHNFFANDILVHNSVYFTLDKLVESAKQKKPNITHEEIVNFLDDVCKKVIDPFIDKSYQVLANHVNANENKMHMKREKISEKGLWVAKKRYATLVWDDEGVRFKEPKLKVTGIEIVRSSTPAKIKPFLKESLIRMMKDPNSINEYVKSVRSKFGDLTPEEIAFPRSVNNIAKYSSPTTMYQKGCPIGVRAAIVYNNYLKKAELGRKFSVISEGSKIKFLYMHTPNPFFNSNVMGFVKRFPNADETHKYIDYDTQFEKAFLAVIESIGEKVGIQISVNQQSQLEDLF